MANDCGSAPKVCPAGVHFHLEERNMAQNFFFRVKLDRTHAFDRYAYKGRITHEPSGLGWNIFQRHNGGLYGLAELSSDLVHVRFAEAVYFLQPRYTIHGAGSNSIAYQTIEYLVNLVTSFIENLDKLPTQTEAANELETIHEPQTCTYITIEFEPLPEAAPFTFTLENVDMIECLNVIHEKLITLRDSLNLGKDHCLPLMRELLTLFEWVRRYVEIARSLVIRCIVPRLWSKPLDLARDVDRWKYSIHQKFREWSKPSGRLLTKFETACENYSDHYSKV